MENENKEIKDENLEETNEKEVVSEEVVSEENEIKENENTEETEANLDTVTEKNEEEKKEEAPYTGKQVMTSTKYDYKTMKYFNMYNTVAKRHLPTWYIVMAVLSLAFATYTIVSGIIAHNAKPETSMASSFVFGGIFILFTVYLFRQAFKFEDLIDRTIVNHFQSHKVAKQNIRVREDKIILIPVDKPEESFAYDWLQITSIEEIDEYIYLLIGKQPIIISKDPNDMVEGTYEELMAIIDEKVKSKPYKYYKKKFVKKPITYVHKEDLEAQEEAMEVENESEVKEEALNETIDTNVENEVEAEVCEVEEEKESVEEEKENK